MKFPDPDLDWVALLEAQGAGPEKYHMHSNSHAMAFQKYAVAAKQAKASGNAERAKLLRKIGNKHKAAADALAAIANHHVDATYGLQLKKKAQLMPKKKPVNEEMIEEIEIVLDEDTVAALDELAENGLLEQYLQLLDESEELEEELEEEVNPIHELITSALTESPLVFQGLVHDIISERVSEALESLKVAIQEGVAADSDGSDEDSEEDSEESPELQEDVELDEVSSKKLERYGVRASSDLTRRFNKIDGPMNDKDKRSYQNRSQGLQTAYKKVVSKDARVKATNEAYRYATTEPGPEGHGTRPPMGQEHLAEPTGKKFPTGRQDVDANKLPKIGTKKKSQKGTTVAAGDTVRTQRAAD